MHEIGNHQTCSLWPRRTPGCPQSPLAFNMLFVLVRTARQKKAKNGIWIGKENKLSLLSETWFYAYKTLKTPPKCTILSIGLHSLGQIAEPVTWRGNGGYVDFWLQRFLFGLLCSRTWMGVGGSKAAHIMLRGKQRQIKGPGSNIPFTGRLQWADSLPPGHTQRLSTPPLKHHSLLSRSFILSRHLRSNYSKN